MYDHAKSVNDFITNQVWDQITSAQLNPFVQFNLSVFEPECSGTTTKSIVQLCNATLSTPPNTTRHDDTYCTTNGVTVRRGFYCCESRINISSCSKPPTDRPYVTRHALAKFANKSDESWGKLQFTISMHNTQDDLRTLESLNQILVRGASVYLEDAVIEEDKAQALVARLTPLGSTTTRIINVTKQSSPACTAEIEAGQSTSDCQYDIYHFNLQSGKDATPRSSTLSGGTITSIYEVEYYNTDKNGLTCSGNTPPNVVFDKDTGRKWLSKSTGKPMFHYCTPDMDFSSLEQSDAPQSYADHNSPFNFASVFSTFELNVASDAFDEDSNGKPLSVSKRSFGIDLTNVKSILIGLWLRATSLAADTADVECALRT
jgi:hypothetical protein